LTNHEFSIEETTLQRLISLKTKMGFKNAEWDNFLNNLLDSLSDKKTTNSDIEEMMKTVSYERHYENWVKNFALNLNDIWNEPSARNLTPDSLSLPEKNYVIVIGRGPSIKKHKHLELLADSKFQGAIVCCDGALKNALDHGITPEKFSNFFVVTIDTDPIIEKYYSDKIIEKYGKNIKGIFSTLVDPGTVKRARDAGIQIHWLHSLFDYDEGKKSFNQISALLTRAKKHTKGLPAIQTGGNSGTASWFISWQILKANHVVLIGINHGWNEDDPWQKITSHDNCHNNMELDSNNETFQKLYKKIYNPDFNCYCILDPVYQYYSLALKDFILRSPKEITTINATEGGSIFGERIKSMKFSDFLISTKI